MGTTRHPPVAILGQIKVFPMPGANPRQKCCPSPDEEDSRSLPLHPDREWLCSTCGKRPFIPGSADSSFFPLQSSWEALRYRLLVLLFWHFHAGWALTHYQ